MKVVKSDHFQEKDVVRIIITSGDKWFDKTSGITVAHFILGNIEDVLEEFDNDLYRRLIEECHFRLLHQRPLNTNFFINHTNPEVRSLAAELAGSPYEYGEKQKNKIQGNLKRFKARKVDRMIRRNKGKMEDAFKSGSEDLPVLFKIDRVLRHTKKQLLSSIGGE